MAIDPGGRLNIFQVIQRWLRELDGNARAGRAVREQRRVAGNPSSPAAGSALEKPASTGIREGIGHSQEYASTSAVTALKWVKNEETAVVAGRNIGGMVYLGPDQRRGGLSAMWRSTIVPTLPVAASVPDISGDSMTYWPGYSELSPSARAAYLDWLATGRSDRGYGVGHVFLYFYGLERRFFADSPDPHERRIIIDEVDRLLQIYGDHRSVRRYFESFLDAARASFASDEEMKPRFWTAGYELPLGLRVALGRRASDGLPMDADWALSWYCAHPEFALRTAASRAFPEFQALFRILFAERYPAGMKIPLPKRTLLVQYRAASSEFEVSLGEYIGAVPDISRITQPLNAARTLVEEATDSLDKYSRFLGRNPNGRGTIEAHALLPERLWEVFPSSEMDGLREWAGEIIGAGGLCPVEAVVKRLEGAVPEKIGKRQLTDAADALARLSLGMAPDPRFALRSPKLGQPIVLFGLPEGVTRLEAVSDRYRNLLVSVAIGSFVAQADESVGESELNALAAAIDRDPDLPEGERSRLQANLKWMMAVEPDLSLLRTHLRNASNETSHEMGQIALSIAASDGVISGKEVAALERLYSALGLEPGGIYSALHSLTSADDPVTVIPPAEGQPGFAIPPRPDSGIPLSLDADRVAAVMTNTARVSALLNEIFQDDEPEEEPTEDHGQAASEFGGLDKKHAAFLGELISRHHWDEDEYRTLAHQFKLLPDGAMETVNEWSHERFGDLLIEEDNGFLINFEVKDEILAVAE